MASPLSALKFLFLKTPFIIKSAILHILGLSSTSRKWDLRTALTVTVLRELLTGTPMSSITAQQENSLKDPGVKGGLWVSRVTMPAPPEDGLRDLLFAAIRALNQESEEFSHPDLLPVTAEWTGYRANVPKNEPEPAFSEAGKYEGLMKETTNDITVLYFHGGAYYLMDPSTSRGIVSKYAQATGGRVLSVRYRLAPQNPFPAALLDALVAYLSLLYPPPDALHEPVSASHIVIGGDSSGGNLSLVLLQTLLQIHRDTRPGDVPSVMFHGKTVELPLPAGIVAGSPACDLSHALRTSKINAQYDYISMRSSSPRQFPPCHAWPADPPRAHLYCEGSALCHPLVSPLTAPSWVGSPPVFIGCGQEMSSDESKAWAQKAAQQGVPLIWEQYEAMPHCFWHLFPETPVGSRFFEGWSAFVKMAVEKPPEISTRGELIVAKSLESKLVDVFEFSDVREEEILHEMRSMRDEIVRNAQLV